MSVDRWGDDQLFEEAVQLTRAQIALRDNEDMRPSHAGEARARRLGQMQRELAECADFIADLDRYASHAAQAQLVGRIVGPYMARMIAEQRLRVAERGDLLRTQLAYLRGQS